MKRIVEIAMLVPGMLALSGDALFAAVDAKASYQIIVDRNPFGLRPLPPPLSAAGPPEPPPKPPANFKLVGITSIQSPKKALIKKTETGPGANPNGKYFRIEEGGRDGDIDVLEIDAKNGSVKIAYAGNNSVLKFEKENVKAAGTPGGPAMPNYAAVPGMGLPPPALNTTGSGAAYYQPNAGVPLGGRYSGQPLGNPANSGGYNPSGNIPPPGGTPIGTAPQFNFQLNTPGSGEPVRTVPTRQLRINGAPQSSSPPTPVPMEPDQQRVLMHLNQIISPDGPPFPPLD